MNPFKKIYNEFIERLHFDVKLRDHGVSFNVNLDPDKNAETKKSFSVSVCGLDNPVGGILACGIESMEGSPENHIVPNISNTANMFLFLNGKLLPDEVPNRCTLSEYVFGEEISRNIRNESWYTTFDGEIALGEGYKLYYAYIHPLCIREYLDKPDRTLSEFIDTYTVDVLPGHMPGDTNFVRVEPYDNGSMTDEELKLRKITNGWEDILAQNFDTATISCKENEVPLVAIVTKYLYSNILREVQAVIKEMTKSAEAHDIPWTNDDLQQTKWLAKVKKSVKDEGVWKQVQSLFVVDWK